MNLVKYKLNYRFLRHSFRSNLLYRKSVSNEVKRFSTYNIKNFCDPSEQKVEINKEETFFKENHTYLGKNFESMIKINGPISLYDFMKIATTSPLESYYTKSEIFGNQGDFVTSPEISQVFGELLGLWYLTQWKKAGRPHKVQVIELGPGKGTLMNDMIRTWRRFPEFFATLTRIDLMEASEPLARIQAKKLAPQANIDHLPPLLNSPPKSPALPQGLLDLSSGVNLIDTIFLRWHSHSEYVFEKKNLEPDSWKIILAHEFFDALPIYKFKKTPDGWREVMVDIDTSKESPFRFTLFDSPVSTKASRILASQLENANYVDLNELEIAPETVRISNQIGSALKTSTGGAALIVDYGEDFPEGNTLRGIKNHRFCYPLSLPGRTDLSTNVDFSLIRESLVNCTNSEKSKETEHNSSLDNNDVHELFIHGPVNQEIFLHNMGIQNRLQMLMKSFLENERKTSNFKDPSEKAKEFKMELESAYKRLTNKDQMGKLYKFLGVTTSPNRET